MPNKETVLLTQLSEPLKKIVNQFSINLELIPNGLWEVLTTNYSASIGITQGPQVDKQGALAFFSQPQERLLTLWGQGQLDETYIETVFKKDVNFGPWKNLERYLLTENPPTVFHQLTFAEVKAEFNLKAPNLALGLTVAPYPKPVSFNIKQGGSILAIINKEEKNRLAETIINSANAIGAKTHFRPTENFAENIFKRAKDRKGLEMSELAILTQPLTPENSNQLIALIAATEMRLSGLTLITMFTSEEWRQQLSKTDLPTLTKSLQSADLTLHFPRTEHTNHNLPTNAMIIVPAGAASFPAWQLKD